MEPEVETISISTYFNDICRLCLSKGTPKLLRNLEGDIVVTVFNFLEVLLHRKLPETVCEQCFEELTQMTFFIRKCKHSQSILQHIEEECAKVQAANNVQIEIFEPEVAEEVIIDADAFDFETENIKTEPDVEVIEDCLKSSEDYVNSSEEDILINDLNIENYENQNENYVGSSEDNILISKINIERYENNNEVHINLSEEDVFISEVNVESHENQNNPNTENVINDANNLNICEKCGDIVEKMNVHYKMSKSCRPKNIKCPECNMYFEKRDRLKSHRIAHHWKETYPHFMCHICSKMFKYEVNLKRHIQVHELGKRFICEICGKSFTTKMCVEDHVNVHTGKKPFSCSFCNKAFSTRSLCNIHKKRHLQKIEGQRKNPEFDESGPAICDICNKQFVHYKAMRMHKLSHDENRVFTCHTCQIKFPSKMFLMRHYETHSEKKLHECSYCSKSFKLRSTLATHMRTHTGERPYTCSVCSKAFTQATHLSYHMLLHTNEKSFVCQYCNKSFAVKWNLTVHLRIHTGERPYKCHVCEQGFRDSSARKRHVISKHGKEQVAYIRTVDVIEM